MNVTTKIKREIAAMVSEEAANGADFTKAKALLTEALDEINLLRVERAALTKEIGHLNWALNMIRAAMKRIDGEKQ